MVQILDINGKLLFSTNKHGKVRRLLRDKKAKLITKEPFTIQLLCKLEESGEFNYKEKNNMKGTIIVSNKLSPSNRLSNSIELGTVYYTYHDFMLLATSDEGITMDDTTLMFDIEDMTKELYDSIEVWVKELNPGSIKFFIYHDKSFIKEPIELITKNSKLSHEEMMTIEYGTYKPVISNGSTLVYSTDSAAKAELLHNIDSQLSKREFECITCSLDSMTIEQINQTLVKFTNEMMQRFKLMEQEQVNNAYKLQNPPPYMALIINDFDKIVKNDNYKCVESIKSSLGSLVRLSKATCMQIIVSVSSLDASEYILQNFAARIVLGYYNKEVSLMLYNTDDVQQLPKGIGLVNSGDECMLFSINEVKNA